MAICIVNAMEQQRILSVDIPGAFLQSPWPEGDDCYLKFTGMMLNMLCKINPNYKNNIHVDRYGRKFLYGKLNKAVYGMLIGARCWFNELTRVLKY